MDYNIEITNIIKKWLYGINQELKTIYTEYNIYPNSYVDGELGFTNSIGIDHYSFIKNNIFPKEFIITLNSKKIYKAYDKYKKGFRNIIFNNNTIYITSYLNDELIQIDIGTYINIESIMGINMIKKSTEIFQMFVNFNKHIVLTEENSDEIKKNGIIDIEYPYHFRIVKNVVPGAKSPFIISLQFNENDEYSYSVVIQNDKEYTMAYHKYICAYIYDKIAKTSQ
jgi:hypothetical protein